MVRERAQRKAREQDMTGQSSAGHYLHLTGRGVFPSGSLLPLMATLGLLGFEWNMAVAAQPPGPDAFGYTVQTTTQYAFLQITNRSGATNVGTKVLSLDDDTPYTANIGFTFNFYGTNYTNISFTPNGFMTFTAQSSNYVNVDLTSASPSNDLPAIAVLWDDWDTQQPYTDAVYYKTVGTAPSRQFVVQWNKLDAVNSDGTNTVTFEARLFESSNRILFSYFNTVIADESTPIASLGVGATVGIRDTSGQTNGRNLEWSYNQGVITNGLNLLFSLANHPPVASNDLATTLEDTPVTINVLANDSDSDADPLALVSVTQPANGVVTTNLNTTVTFMPATNFFGTDQFSYTISDGQGGSATGMVSVAVIAVNDRPTLDPLSGLAILEDAGPQTVSLTGISAGTANENDTLTVIADTTNTALVTNLVVSYTSPDSTGSLSFNLVTNAFGTATITVTVNDGQPSNNIVSRSLTLTVTPVNDPPTLAPLNNLNILENAGMQVVSLIGISPGPGSEKTQAVSITAMSSNPALIPNPSVNYTSPGSTGTLTFAPLTNQFGTATIKVVLQDNGGTANGGMDSLTNSFTVTVAGLMINSISNQPGGTVVIRFQGISGHQYAIEASQDLMSWSTLSNALEDAPGEFEFEDTRTASFIARFYRLRSL